MRILSKIMFALVLVSALVLSACSPSSKNETQYWENHKKDAEEFKGKYAGFVTVIDAEMKKATAVMDEAGKLTDEAKKAEKMKEGNAVAAKVVGRLAEIRSKSDSLTDKISDLGKLKLSGSKATKRKKAMGDAQDVLNKVNEALVNAKPTTVEEAETVMSEQVSALISAQGSADRSYKAVAPAKKKKKKKKSKKKKK